MELQNTQGDLTHIALVAKQLGVVVPDVEALVVELNMMPARRVAFIPHFTGDQVAQISKHLEAIKSGEVEPTVFSPKRNYPNALPLLFHR